jgi:hypothetical protein
MKKTTYYYVKTNASSEVIAECNGKATLIPQSNGEDVTTGVDLYTDDTLSKLREAYKQVDGLYNFEEIQQDFDWEVFDFNEDEFESVEKIIEA